MAARARVPRPAARLPDDRSAPRDRRSSTSTSAAGADGRRVEQLDLIHAARARASAVWSSTRAWSSPAGARGSGRSGRRCGRPSRSRELARAIVARPDLELAGVMGYEGTSRASATARRTRSLGAGVRAMQRAAVAQVAERRAARRRRRARGRADARSSTAAARGSSSTTAAEPARDRVRRLRPARAGAVRPLPRVPPAARGAVLPAGRPAAGRAARRRCSAAATSRRAPPGATGSPSRYLPPGLKLTALRAPARCRRR